VVNGVRSVLAFEALNQHNKPVSISGAIIKTANNAVVDSFCSANGTEQ
jgi:hypothetical protein